ncbi:DNA/RNA non-specific endonuclease [Herbiconiux daphne]|uniref:DNA/RNA non-specific endonuclease n=1 Tax=Herbiconiux daphne TaxID=2970914 RepID=A0ABT2H1P8_9MICO|nr:DNA/RNA non-specific endonuclease [Herbiconiux daphne]MCS5733839.1 DNA/RNA non-specific endonuclease [Herbiconiux daphne]
MTGRMTDDSTTETPPEAPPGIAPGLASGFAPGFLGPDCPVAVPRAGRPIVPLAYTHFTVLLDTSRRLAALTAVNIDGLLLTDVARTDDWHLDDRVDESQQAGPELYARNDLDRGHLVRRRDPVWGDEATARRAEFDSFVYTNAAPQAAVFNQSPVLWNGLEDYLLDYAAGYRVRLNVFTGVVFADDDPLYRGIRIPRLFWKVAAWADAATHELATTGYVLDQSPQLDAIDLTALVAGADAPPPLGGFLTFEAPVADIQRLTDLDFGPLVDADRFTPVPQATEAGHSGWKRLRHFADISIDPPPPG